MQFAGAHVSSENKPETVCLPALNQRLNHLHAVPVFCECEGHVLHLSALIMSDIERPKEGFLKSRPNQTHLNKL